MGESIGIAMVGCGQIAEAHLKGVGACERARLAFCVDVDPERARAAAERHGAPRWSADYAEALSYYEQALAIAHEIGDRLGESLVLNNLGLATSHQGNYAGAWSYYERALAITREIGDRRGDSGRISCSAQGVFADERCSRRRGRARRAVRRAGNRW